MGRHLCKAPSWRIRKHFRLNLRRVLATKFATLASAPTVLIRPCYALNDICRPPICDTDGEWDTGMFEKLRQERGISEW